MPVTGNGFELDLRAGERTGEGEGGVHRQAMCVWVQANTPE
jgi:hypothetical protein